MSKQNQILLYSIGIVFSIILLFGIGTISYLYTSRNESFMNIINSNTPYSDEEKDSSPGKNSQKKIPLNKLSGLEINHLINNRKAYNFGLKDDAIDPKLKEESDGPIYLSDKQVHLNKYRLEFTKDFEEYPFDSFYSGMTYINFGQNSHKTGDIYSVMIMEDTVSEEFSSNRYSKFVIEDKNQELTDYFMNRPEVRIFYSQEKNTFYKENKLNSEEPPYNPHELPSPILSGSNYEEFCMNEFLYFKKESRNSIESSLILADVFSKRINVKLDDGRAAFLLPYEKGDYSNIQSNGWLKCYYGYDDVFSDQIRPIFIEMNGMKLYLDTITKVDKSEVNLDDVEKYGRNIVNRTIDLNGSFKGSGATLDSKKNNKFYKEPDLLNALQKYPIPYFKTDKYITEIIIHPEVISSDPEYILYSPILEMSTEGFGYQDFEYFLFQTGNNQILDYLKQVQQFKRLSIYGSKKSYAVKIDNETVMCDLLIGFREEDETTESIIQSIKEDELTNVRGIRFNSRLKFLCEVSNKDKGSFTLALKVPNNVITDQRYIPQYYTIDQTAIEKFNANALERSKDR